MRGPINVPFIPYYIAYVPIRGRAPGVFSKWGWIIRTSTRQQGGMMVPCEPHFAVYGAFHDGPHPVKFDNSADAISAATEVDREWRVVMHIRPAYGVIS